MNRSNREISEAAAQHSFASHGHEFINGKAFGGRRAKSFPVYSEVDLAAHVAQVLADPRTRTFVGPVTQPERTARFHYNRPMNTWIAVPLNNEQPPTVFRPKTGSMHFRSKLEHILERDGRLPMIARSVDLAHTVERDREQPRTDHPRDQAPRFRIRTRSRETSRER